MTEPWPLYDECPAFDDWPGGKRYGFKIEHSIRDWTAAERAVAEFWGIELPDVNQILWRTWFDQPYPTLMHASLEPIEIGSFDLDAPIEPIMYREYATQARRYGQAVPVFDLQAAITAERKRRMAEVPRYLTMQQVRDIIDQTTGLIEPEGGR